MRLKVQAKQFGQRLLQQHLRIGVTGLSGAGKTAFITRLVALLTQPGGQALPFFQVMQQQRYLGGTVVDNASRSRARFPYELNLQQIAMGQWPASTEKLSQITLQLRYQSRHPLRSRLQSYQTLIVELTDYPGEWLLDLPMLRQTFAQWNQQCYQQLTAHQQLPAVSAYLALLAGAPADVTPLLTQQLTDSYRQALQALRQQGQLQLQPGRLLRPAELDGSPLLQLFAMAPDASDSPLGQWLAAQFAAYQQEVIKPFYRDYFAALDRQVILVDCLGALNQGYQALTELQQVLLQLGSHFQYGSNHWFYRLFAPRINKVLFAASKADLLTPEQHRNLLLLMQQMLQQPLYQHKYQLCQSEVLAIASVVSARTGQVAVDGQMVPCLQGHLQSTGELSTLYPGEVPISMPSAAVFAQHQFAFPQFLPWVGEGAGHSLRFDQVLQFLLGDDLQ